MIPRKPVYRASACGILFLMLLAAASCSPNMTGPAPATPAQPAAQAVTPVAPSGALTPPTTKESPFTGYYAPDFTLTDLDGQRVKLSDYRGHPVWINLWATWCVPCKTEMPAMQKLYNQYKAQGLVILGVDAQEDRATVASYIQQGAYTWRILLDPGSEVRTKYLFVGVPSHVFIDKAGVIRAISVGQLDDAGMASYLARIVQPGS